MCNVHPFEKAGLGKAPFKYVGLQYQEMSYGERVLGHVGGCAITTKPGGTCAYCGTYIVDMYNVASADGQRFHVGCECIRKVGDTSLVKQIDSDRKKLARDKRHNRERERETENQQWYAENRDKLSSLPHPNEYFAKQGKTYLDYTDWIMQNAGVSGRARVIGEAKKKLEE